MKSALLGAALSLSPSPATIAPVQTAPSLSPSAAPSLPLLAPSALNPTLAVPAAPERPRTLLPTEIPALPGFPGLALPQAAKPLPSGERQSAEAAARFDGARAGDPGEGWTSGTFEGDGGAAIAYKSRRGAGSAPARVYAGGLALNESFEPLFARPAAPAGNELFVWTRGHRPSEWLHSKSPIDADARDLARAVSLAAESSPGGKVELALHSFGTLVFQRMIQLHEEPAVAAALKALAGSRVFMLHATTHYEGSERKAGPDFERMSQATRAVVDWLDAGDATADLWRRTAEFNPFLAPMVAAWLQQWDFQRGQVISMAARDAAKMMKADLSEPWDKAVDHIRKAFLKDLAADARDPAWQESMLRRSSDMFRLEFSPEDAARIKTLGIRLELVHADGDKLLNWESAKALFERLGIPCPAKAPPVGAVLRDASGRFRARLVSGDHYWPLKRRDELAALLKP
ncbi:MAG: hypothetical protein M0D55_08380 [Elusimicrobiota bacterium]|nr:MAG: hypothetical protein M0D55_08380 [Elusimicrobiota bacterium]